MEKKLSTSVENLCKGLPQEFVQYLNYCRNLRFEDKPDYSLVKNLLKDIFVRMNYEFDFTYDWSKPKEIIKASDLSKMSEEDKVISFSLFLS